MEETAVEHADPAARRRVATAMAEAALAWLEPLDGDRLATARGRAPTGDDADAERRRWFYTPTDHGGLTLHRQRPEEQQAAMRLVAAGLSPAAYGTVAAIIGLENVLDRAEGFRRTRGRHPSRDPGLYYLRVFGEPGGEAPWGWRFGGHHVSLNHLVVDGALVASTPCFLGANPASTPMLGGELLRPLGRVEDLARELVRSLTGDAARAAGLSGRAPTDLVTRNRSLLSDPGDPVELVGGPGGTTPGDVPEALLYAATPRGVPAAALESEQRELLRALLGAHLDRVPAEVSPAARYDDPAVLDRVHLGWAGPTGPGEPHYYRLQGPRLLVEWDNTQHGANHAHSVWRDPGADFGLDVLARHRAAHHPHHR